MTQIQELRLPALEIHQGPERRLYCFAIDGKKLGDFAAISRIKRDDGGGILGYQRPEIASHISEIREYVESENPMIPNALVVAFDDRVRFESSGEIPSGENSPATIGELVIQVDSSLPESDKPGWVVDGQQRLAAIREAEVDTFPICVVSFIAADAVEQCEQFILVNSTRPLPKGLIYELLPTTEARLPSLLQRRRFPAALLARLNGDEDSPLCGMIRTPTNPDGVIKDNSILKMLENSLNDGVLYRYRSSAAGEPDTESMMTIIKAFWRSVSEVFPDAWGLTPRRSRLMHGVGIVSLGFVMDAIADRDRDEQMPTEDRFRADLAVIAPCCRWTDGFWDFGPGQQRKWNEVQNTHRDIQTVANFLLVQYRALVWSTAS